MRSADLTASRRRFLRLLASVPLLSSSAPANQGESPIATPEQALNVMEFEAVARKELPSAHFGYLATGVDDDATVRANRDGFTRLEIRARRLIDVRNVDTSIRLFGAVWDTPI